MKRQIIFVLIVLVVLSSCKKMEYFQDNPNAPTQPNPGSLLTYLERNLFTFSTVASGDDAYFLSTGLALQHLVGFSNHSLNGQSYVWTTSNMNEYQQITNAQEMINAANGNNAYVAIGKLFIAINYYMLTNKFGDVPCSQALQLAAGVKNPVYDEQKDVYKTILASLDTANNLITTGTAVSGDFIYNGNLSKWQKFINSFRLRVIMSLSRKTADPELNPASLFAEVMNNPAKYPLFQSNADHAQQATNLTTPYVLYNNQAWVYFGMAKPFCDSLKAFRDPRLIHWASITSAAAAAGKSIYDYDAYAGLPPDASNAENTAHQSEASMLNPGFFSNPSFEPNLYLGFYEVNFAIAEGIERGWWAGGNPETYYKQGITASLAYYNIPQDTIDRYLSEPKVAYNPARGLEQILYQRYIASNYNTGYEPYFTIRRTGIPAMQVAGPGIPSHSVPLRWRYPTNEYTLNTDNINTAVARQFPGGDQIGETMWLLKP